jgi:hypothetical protein
MTPATNHKRLDGEGQAIIAGDYPQVRTMKELCSDVVK